MADGYVQVPTDSVGKKIDTTELVTTVGTVERQRVAIPDAVNVDGAQLIRILVEQRLQNILLAAGLNIEDDIESLRDDVALDAGSGTFAYLNVGDQLMSGGANVTSYNLGTVSSGSITIDCGKCPLQYLSNGGAFTLVAPSNDGSVMLLVTNTSAAGAITFSGFTVGASVGDTLTTTSASKFTLSIWRINSVSGYRVAAHQ